MANREGDNGRIYHAAIYVRLSKEDKEKVESDSIVNQKALIKNYLADKRDIVVCMECVDDGFSGVDFERPSFKRMIGEIENGNIDCVIVKDLSRFGRNFVETGRYLDQFFPALGVRFIAVNDGFDSVDGRNFSDRILIPFKNLIKNTSYLRREFIGYPLGFFPCFGRDNCCMYVFMLYPFGCIMYVGGVFVGPCTSEIHTKIPDIDFVLEDKLHHRICPELGTAGVLVCQPVSV